jgi:hypothetical protein
MVVSHFLDPDLSDLGAVDAAVFERRNRVGDGFKNESVGSPKIDGEVAGAIGVQGVAIARHVVHVREGRGGEQRCQPALEELPLVRAPVLAALAVVGARLLQLPARP